MSKEENKTKKLLRKQKRSIRNDKCKAFFIRYQKPIAITLITIYLIGLLAVLCSSIAGLVFNLEKINIGPVAKNILTYDKPASKINRTNTIITKGFGLDRDYDIFQQASLPIGNGDIGASILGETDVDKIIFNEKTLWSGGPKEGQIDYNGDNFTGKANDGLYENQRYYKVQEYLLKGDVKSAEKLFDNLQGNIDNKGAYLPFGDLVLNFGHKKVKGYNRTLDIDNALCSISYLYNNVKFSREILASNPHNVIAIKLSTDDKLNVKIGFNGKQSSNTKAKDDYIYNLGKLENGLNFYSYIKIDPKGGNLDTSDNTITIKDTSTAYIYMSAATDYKQEFPKYRTGESVEDLISRVQDTVNKAYLDGYNTVKAQHISDYERLFNRVKVNLGGIKPNFTTDKLVSRYKTIFLYDSHRRYLEQLLFNYGRYLLISCSRANSKLPANLQGVWNQANNAPWGSDYHINVNLQMNYWPAYNTNLFECATPLVEFVDKLREPGRITAKTYTATQKELDQNLPNSAYGFIANTECNPYGHTTPGTGEFVRALWSPAAVAWLIQNLYEGYEYNKNISYLEKIYPIMLEALRYFERTMVMYNGRLVTAPAYSPEHGPLSAGNTYEQSLVWQLINDTMEASNVLNLNQDKLNRWKDMQNKLKPLEIAKGGQLKEWYDETINWSMGRPFHRHTSHLLGLFPGDLINKESPKDIIDAVNTTLSWRGKKSTGWAMGQRINTYARLGDGKNAFQMIKQLLSSGIYKNLYDAHPPFQIDGNFGYTAGVSEMLVQSNLGYIDLLPAIPKEWNQGEISGLVARGNFIISMHWENGNIISAEIVSQVGGKLNIALNNGTNYIVVDNDNNPVSYNIINNKISFDTDMGKTYKIILK